MPKLVNQLDLKNRSQLTNAYQVLATDPLDFEIYRVPVTNFRGAGVFVSQNEPTTNPEDNTLTEYINGDVFIQESSNGLQYYSWDSVNSVWKSETKLNGLRVLTAIDFPDEVNLDLRDTNFISSKAYADDYYLNKSLQLLFSYSPTVGFQFGSTTFSGYEAFRAPTVFDFQGKDAQGYTNPKLYLHEYFASSTSDLNKRRYSLPILNDNVHIKLENDEGHGGWVWYFKPQRDVTNASNYFDNYNEKLGVDVGGLDITNRFHAREAKVWNENTTPVQNNKKYRQGDSVLVLTSGVLYYNYQEDAPDNTIDLGVLFEGQTILSGSALKTAQDVDGNWVTPTANDSIFQNGDYILTKEGGTPRIHGPYKFGASSDVEAFPLYTILRSPIEHVVNWDDAVIISYLGDYPYNADGVMIAPNDVLHAIYTAGVKEYLHPRGAIIDYITKIIDWQLNSRVPLHPTRITHSTAVGEPSIDNLVYYDGEIVRNVSGDLFKYVEDFVTPADSSFLQLPNLRANITHIVETADGDYVPDVINGSSDWGGSSVNDNDTLEVRCTAVGSTKVVAYTAEVNEVNDILTWVNRRNLLGVRAFESTNFGDPDIDDNIYTHGDYIVNASGRKYKYDELSNPSVWNFVEWVRAPEVYSITKVNGYVPAVFSQYFVETDFTQKRIKVGDKFVVNVDGTTNGKNYYYYCTQEEPVLTFSEKVYRRSTTVFTEITPDRPNLNDADYSTGDFLDNPLTGWRYGPYVEGAVDNTTAWPDFRSETILTDGATGKYRVGRDTDLLAGGVTMGFLPRELGTGDGGSNSFLGKTNTWFKEAWCNTYRGGSIDVSEVLEGGTHVYSPNNKPTADDVDAVSTYTLVQLELNDGSFVGATLPQAIDIIGNALRTKAGVLHCISFDTTSMPILKLLMPTDHAILTIELTGLYAHCSVRHRGADSKQMWFTDRQLGFGGGASWNQVYHTNNNPTAPDVKAVEYNTLTGAAYMPAGTTAQRPNTSTLPANTKALRFNTTLNEWEGEDAEGNYAGIGGGGVPVMLPKEGAVTIVRNKAIDVDLASMDGVVTVPQGLVDTSWFGVKTKNFSVRPNAVITINFTNEFAVDNKGNEYGSFLIDRPCTVYFQKIEGKWAVVDATGEQGNLNGLTNRVEALEKPSPELWGSIGTSGALSESIYNFDSVLVTTKAIYTGGLEHIFTAILPTNAIANSTICSIASYTGNTTSLELLNLFLSFPTPISFTTSGGTAMGSGWVSHNVVSIKGVYRL